MAKKKSKQDKRKSSVITQKKEKAIVEEEPKILLADDDSSSGQNDDVANTHQDDVEEQKSVSTEEGSEIEPDEFKEDNDDDPNEEEKENEGGNDEEEVKPSSNKPAIMEPLAFQSDGRYHNKQRCLILSSRGITSRFRHLLEDLRTLIPHHKKESKLDVSKNQIGGIGAAVNEIAEMRGCNSVLFLECRKKLDAYMWIGHTGVGGGSGGGGGPSAKFLIENIHTMDELRLTGNCMKGSRPILSFDESFEQREELKLLKCLFIDTFGTPRGHPKSKPFVDRVMGFYYADGKIWVRNYQIVEQHATNAKEAHTEKKKHGNTFSTNLVEIGPRFVLNPIRIFRGSFGGQTIYQNERYVSPNSARSNVLKDKGRVYEERKNAQKKRKLRQEEIVIPEDPLDSVFR